MPHCWKSHVAAHIVIALKNLNAFPYIEWWRCSNNTLGRQHSWTILLNKNWFQIDKNKIIDNQNVYLGYQYYNVLFAFMNLAIKIIFGNWKHFYLWHSLFLWLLLYLGTMYIWAVPWDFQQCDILTSVDSDEPVQPPFKLGNYKWCSVSSLTLIEYSRD